MAFCSKCGATNAEGAKFCAVCGGNVVSGSPIPAPAPVPMPAQPVYPNGNMNTGKVPSSNGITRRNIFLCFLFSFLTCGIYMLYWIYKMTEESKQLSEDYEGASGGLTIVFMYLSCGLYTSYWAYKQGQRLNEASVKRGYPSESKGIFFMILTAIGQGAIALALMQDTINKMVD